MGHGAYDSHGANINAPHYGTLKCRKSRNERGRAGIMFYGGCKFYFLQAINF